MQIFRTKKATGLLPWCSLLSRDTRICRQKSAEGKPLSLPSVSIVPLSQREDVGKRTKKEKNRFRFFSIMQLCAG